MNDLWKKVTIEIIRNARHCKSTIKNIRRETRPYQAFFINDPDTIRDFYFDDGKILRTKGNSLFYLPKGSSYSVIDISGGSCYFIDFEANFTDVPFCVNLTNVEKLIPNMNKSINAWRNFEPYGDIMLKRTLYDIIYNIIKEDEKKYVSSEQIDVIKPVVDILNNNFTDPDLKISEVVSLCNVSGVYFRRIFMGKFGISPKEYVIQKRISLTKELIELGYLSVSQVAARCGYTDASHFSREFTKRVGAPPSQYSITFI